MRKWGNYWKNKHGQQPLYKYEGALEKTELKTHCL